MEGILDVGRLSADALRYELKIRGVTGQLAHDEMRCTLRKLIRMEKNASFKLPANPFTYAEDSQAIQTDLAVTEDKVNNFAGTSACSEFKKLNNQLIHLLGRANRANAITAEDKASKPDLVTKIVTLSSRLEIKARATSTPSRTALNLSAINLGNSSSDSSEDSGDDSVLLASKPVPVNKWGVTFSGDDKSSLNAFLERVNELRVARGISRTALFVSAVDLFQDRALIWYRANREKFTSWDQLVDGLRGEFQPVDYDDRLYEEIRHRTQGPTESIGIFVSIIKNLFARLNTKVPENVQLNVILKNLCPAFQRQLALVDVVSIDQLLQLGRRLEATKSAVDNYTPPSRSSKMLEPDLAYVHTESVTVATVMTDARLPVNSVKCWNCRRDGHLAKDCRAPRRVHCFKCGEPDVITRNCRKCSGNGRVMRR